MKIRGSIAVILLFALASFGQAPDKEKVIAGAERAFEKASKTHAMPAPGCSVGVSLSGQSVFEKAFGLAEMEHGVPNTPQTIFESGSVAKQFTAAALVMLSLEGKLGLDDPVRKHIPELPDYGASLTIRHLLTHTAGLRDWGSVMAVHGVGRGDRVVSQETAFDVIIRQKNLDFTPGAEYSYSNSGYQLAAIIVERVSKQSFAAYTEEKFFKPLGMKNSSWRDDHQRLVPGRAQAYSRQAPNGPWRLNMPIMNVVGNGGMLTTAGDWLKWNAALDAKTLGAAFVEALETQGILNDGRKISYALGVEHGTYKGIREVAHSGGTAGYQTYLLRFPEKKLSIGVLCNGYPPSSGDIAYGIVDEIFGPFPEEAKPAGVQVPEEQLKKYVGLYRNERNRNPNRIVIENGALKLNTAAMTPLADGSFAAGSSKVTFVVEKDGRPATARIQASNGGLTTLIYEREWTPAPSDLGKFAGSWYSDEADARFEFKIEAGKAFLFQRPSRRLGLQPLYKDHFQAPGGILVWFTRDAAGDKQMHLGGSRLRDLKFERVRK